MPDQAPPHGLYLKILTEGLEQQLCALNDALVDTDGLEPCDDWPDTRHVWNPLLWKTRA